MIQRVEYLNKLKRWKDQEEIKIITGVRRCGKSELLKQYDKWLQKEAKVLPDNILHIDFEKLEYANFKIKGNLEKFILNWAKDKKVKHYVLLDEIHMMESFAFFLSSIRHYDFLDIYVTDSNTQTLLGKNAQILGGRYIQIKMYPLSFKEIMSDTDMKQDEAFKEYMIYGGFPRLTTIDQTMREDYLKQLLDSIIVNDVQAYAQIRNMNLFLHLVNYLSDNIGRETSNKRISDYISSNYQESHSGKTNETIDEYINALINANIIKRVNRFDIRGKEEFKMLPKYYFVDQGLVNARLGFHNIKKSYVLENIVFVELLRRECNVWVGKNENEIDFYATHNGKKTYIQVSYTISNKDTLKREIKSLIDVKDGNEKIILTLDHPDEAIIDGVKIINLIEWLLDKIYNDL